MTVTRCPSDSQRVTWPYRFVPVPPPCGWVQSRSVKSSTSRAIKGDRSGARATFGARLQSALVPARRRIAAVLAVVAVGAAPGAALAQSGGAGDDQYVDPIGGNSQQQHHGSNSSGGSGSNGPTLSSTPTLSAQASPAATSATPTASAAQTLPRTGVDAWAVAAIGGALLLAGIALRRRLAHEPL
ncbi:MAG: LPXTG cell wall anchor domain-containing protein [Actinobacteria bacterium]|nr:MAG: LPXTG cell wall anchor domain-containing protein [Actinomycetota bacterium]